MTDQDILEMLEREVNDCHESYSSQQNQNQMMYGVDACVVERVKKCHATQIVARLVTMTMEMRMWMKVKRMSMVEMRMNLEQEEGKRMMV